MPRKQFYYHEKGNHDETWYYLSTDASGRAVIEREFSAGKGISEIGAPVRIEISEFLASGSGTPQDNLLRLIAQLTR